jgi:hypothetical protein
MTIADFRETISGAKEDFDTEFVIRTTSGKRYPVPGPGHVWLPPGYESTVCVAVPGKGISLLDIGSIEAVQFEHQAASLR